MEHSILYSDYQAILLAGDSWIYRIAVVMAAFIGGRLILRDARAWPLSDRERIFVFAGTMLGSMIGCGLPAYFAGGFVGAMSEAGRAQLQNHQFDLIFHFLISPKTVLGGLLFGFFGAAITKKLVRIEFDTSDAFARGACLTMALGRLGCIAQHCCFGKIAAVSVLGFDYGDGQHRYPMQLIEFLALSGLFVFMNHLHRHNLWPHRRLFVLLTAYGTLRFVMEFGREVISTEYAGLGFYQWIALAMVATGLFQLAKRSLVSGSGGHQYRTPETIS